MSTETPARRWGELIGFGYGEFDEVLPTNALDPSRLASAPLVETHNLDSIDRVLGVITGTHRETVGL